MQGKNFGNTLFPNDRRIILYNNLNTKNTRVEKILQTTVAYAHPNPRYVCDNTRGEISLHFLRFYFFSRFKRPICKCRAPRNSWACLTVSSTIFVARSRCSLSIISLHGGEKKKRRKTYSKVVYLLIFTSALELHPCEFFITFPLSFFLSVSSNCG